MQINKLKFFSKVHVRSYEEEWADRVTSKISEKNEERVSGEERVQRKGYRTRENLRLGSCDTTHLSLGSEQDNPTSLPAYSA